MSVWKSKLRAFGIHMAVSALVAALSALVVFRLWYPSPLEALSGGRNLYVLVLVVDVVLGPLMTLAVFDTKKSRRELLADLIVIACLQMAALAYGLHTVVAARPVHVVFEYDRFRVLHASDIPEELVKTAPRDIDTFPLTGPTWISLRPLTAAEKFDYTIQALNGVAVSAVPRLWQPYDEGRERILAAARPAKFLLTRFPDQAGKIQTSVNKTGYLVEQLTTLPLLGRSGKAWTALLDARTAKPVGFLDIDSF